MKKLLSMMLLALLIVFVGCEDSSTKTATAEEQAAAEGIGTAVYMASATAASAAFNSLDETGVSEASRASSITINSDDVSTGMTGVTISGSVEGSPSSYSAVFTIVFDNYTNSDGIVITGTVTYIISGTDNSSEISIKGDLTVTYGGTNYTIESYLAISISDTAGSIGGYVNINGAKATITYSFTE